ncbi:MAG: DUF2062 domain-containing protein, partial [Thermodesulfobacteriota bacterium]
MSAGRQPRALRAAAVIPVYNHGATLRRVAEGALAVLPEVLVVDDGSSDGGVEALAGLPVQVLRHGTNQGKGAAILTAARAARDRGLTHIVTLDADGQHDPADIARFLAALAGDPTAFLVGARDFSSPDVPGASRFGRSFSNFWMRVQTGRVVSDMQCGFRAYPVDALLALSLRERRYAFEVEALVKAAWAGFPVRDVPVSVHYPPRRERVSHFRVLGDNLEIALLNTRLTVRSFLPVPHRQYAGDGEGRVSPLRPLRSLRILLSRDATPRELALSAFLGVFIGCLPLFFVQTISIVLAASWLGLNRIAALAAGQLCMPPAVPALCVLAGHWLRHGRPLAEFSLRTLGYEAPQRLLEWGLGSLVLAPLLAGAVGGA